MRGAGSAGATVFLRQPHGEYKVGIILPETSIHSATEITRGLQRVLCFICLLLVARQYDSLRLPLRVIVVFCPTDNAFSDAWPCILGAS